MLTSNSQIRVGISVKPKDGSNKKVVKSILMSNNISPYSKKKDSANLSKMNETNQLSTKSNLQNYQIREESHTGYAAPGFSTGGVGLANQSAYQASSPMSKNNPVKTQYPDQMVHKDGK